MELLAALDEAEADIQAGEFDDYTDESLPLLAQQLNAEATQLRKNKPA